MARLFVAGSSQYVTGTVPGVASDPASFSCMFRPATLGANQVLMSVNSPTAQGRMQFIVNPSRQLVIQRVNNSGANDSAVSSAALTVGAWHHCVGVIPATGGNLRVYLNGVEVVGMSNSGAAMSLGTPLMIIGARASSGFFGLFMNGEIAEAGFWNTELTQAEAYSLAAAVTPDQVRLGNLVFYADLVRDIRDLKGGIVLTENGGSTAVTNHPRVFL